ncbi:MAG: hypothetical protein PHH77_11765 [Victivallaceae bacterium]|nr:hypothetical protein [Victivallaceae bacterium]
MEPEHLINALLFAVEQCAKSGLDKKSTAEKLNISLTEFNHLLAELPQLKNALEKGADQAPAQRVEDALLKRALGFEQKEIYSEDIVDKKTGEQLETLKRRIVSKEIAPDVRALLFWLKNRCPQRWSENQPPSDFELELDEDENDL